MKCLYVTSDKFNQGTGGSKVVTNELEFFKTIGNVTVINPDTTADPFSGDEQALAQYRQLNQIFDIAHFYSGTYSKLIQQLKKDGTKVSYTAAAHSIEISKKEHEKLGYTYDYPHLTTPDLWARYVEGYRLANTLIVPSTSSKQVMEGFGCVNKIRVIPHGVDHMPNYRPIPKKFHVGYLGACGCDKGLIYLIKAWKLLGYKDCQLTLAGAYTPLLLPMVREYGGGAVYLSGFVKNIEDFYNSCSVYIQPSASEGFGIEILEAMSHGRVVISTTNNGGPDLIQDGYDGTIVAALDYKSIANAIDRYKQSPDLVKLHGERAREKAKNYTWEKTGVKYKEEWHELLATI